jgi:hypothetical protein
MIVRLATEDDVPQLVELGYEFAQVSQKAHGFSISREKIVKFTLDNIVNENCIKLVLVDEKICGLLVALLMTPFFSDDPIVQEMVWYVQDGCRDGLKLLLRLEKEAKLRGAKKLVMGYKYGFVDMSRIYERMGFKLLEAQYVKELN